jgi:hypothetical protein
MADPNTQIDWWIAQTWQESQGGAENDALVAWLYENGLTATSSYTILQAALSCPPDTAKEIVYGHPAWTGAEPDNGVENLSYTTETLEPEPEPDPTFELDDWADQIEEEEQAPVYGEEGFQAEPGAGASPPAYARESQAPTAADGTILLDPAQSGSDEPAPANDLTNTLNDSGGFEGDASEPFADTGKDVAQEKPAEPSSVSPDTEITKNAPSEEPGLADSDQAAVADLSAPEPADAAPAQPDPEPEQPAMAAIAMPPPLVYQPLPDIQITPPVSPVAPAAPLFALPQRDCRPPPPLFPPTNTADQAVMANDGPTTPLPDSDPAPLPDTPPEQPGSEPVLVANGLDTSADQDSAILEETPDTPPTATVENTGSLRSGMQSAMKHEDAEPQDETVESPSDEGGESVPTDLAPDLTPLDHGQEPEPAPQDNEEEPEPVPQDDGEEPEAALAAVMDITGDLTADMPQADGQVEAEPQSEMVDLPDEEAGEPAPIDWAQELPPLEEEESEDDDPGASSSMAEEGDDGRDGMEIGEDTAPRPQKQALLDRSGDVDEGGLPGSDAVEMPLGDTPEELAAAARKLGIDFRNGDQSDAGVDPEMAKVAKELGISFREGTDSIPPLDDEAAIEAQKLGISFRDGDTVSSKSKKPKLVKYLPFVLAVIVLSILLLLGVTFAGDAISWFGG